MPSRPRVAVVVVHLALASACGWACAGISQRLANPTREGARPLVASRADDPPPGPSGAAGISERLERAPAATALVTWRTFSTAHFVLHTDASPTQATDLLATLERIRASLAAWFDADPVPMEIILFASAPEYQSRFGRTVALHVEMSLARSVFVTHLGQAAASFDEVLDQALVRRFVHAKFGTLPGWLEDGMVTHFGAARLHEDKLLLGGPPLTLGLDKEVGDIAPLLDLFAADAPDAEPLATRTLRTSAWALVGYLLDRSAWGENAAARLQAWLALAGRRGASAKDITDAFTDIYPERSLKDVDFAFRGHARSAAGTHHYQHFIAAPRTQPPVVKAVPLSKKAYVEPVLIKAEDQIAQPRRPDPRQVEAQAQWRADKPRHQMRIAGDWIVPTTTYGLAYGYSFFRDHSIDLEVGRTPLGHFIAPRYRADFEIENARNLFANLALGPQLALKSELFGLADTTAAGDPAAEGPTSFHHLSLSGELAAGVFVWRGLYARASVTLLYKLATNLDDFCKDQRFRNDQSCPDSGLMAGDAMTGFVRLGAGYAW